MHANFDSKQLTVAELLLRIKDEADVWLLAGFKQIGAFPAAFAPLLVAVC